MTTPPFPELHDTMHDDVSRAIDRLTGQDEPSARMAEPKFQRVLACDDDTPTSERVLDWAEAIVDIYGAHVLVASVAVPPAPLLTSRVGAAGTLAAIFPRFEDDYARVERRMRDASEAGARRLLKRGIRSDALTLIGSPAHEIAEAAKADHSDLLILGAKGGGRVSRVLLGSVAEGVSGRVPASILVARTRPKPRIILAATDGSPESHRAVSVALRIASAKHAELVVQHVIEYPSESPAVRDVADLDDAVDKLDLPTPPHVRYALDVGKPAERIVERAEREHADLIVLGARGLGRVTGALLGSVSHRVANSASASVLLVRSSA